MESLAENQAAKGRGKQNQMPHYQSAETLEGISQLPSILYMQSFYTLFNPFQYLIQPLSIPERESIHHMFKQNYIKTPTNSVVFGDSDVPEEEFVKEEDNIEKKSKARQLYTKPTIRPLYSIQVECLIVISKVAHLSKQPISLIYTFNDQIRKRTYYKYILSKSIPLPLGFKLRWYTNL